MSHLDPPRVSDRSKDLVSALISRWFVPADAADLAAEAFRESTGGRLRRPAVYEHEFEALVGPSAGEILECEFDGLCFGC